MRSTYTYNPACRCQWCRNNGQIPAGTASNGHSFGYDYAHHPPSTSPWTKRAQAAPAKPIRVITGQTNVLVKDGNVA